MSCLNCSHQLTLIENPHKIDLQKDVGRKNILQKRRGEKEYGTKKLYGEGTSYKINCGGKNILQIKVWEEGFSLGEKASCKNRCEEKKNIIWIRCWEKKSYKKCGEKEQQWDNDIVISGALDVWINCLNWEKFW